MARSRHRSPHLLVGHWNKPKETEEAFTGGWFHSGDVGYVDTEGYLYIVDRIRDVINTGGVLVASREVEEALFNPSGGFRGRGGWLTRRQMDRGRYSIRRVASGSHGGGECADRAFAPVLAPFKIPKRVVFVDNLPRNTAGKPLAARAAPSIRCLTVMLRDRKRGTARSLLYNSIGPNSRVARMMIACLARTDEGSGGAQRRSVGTRYSF